MTMTLFGNLHIVLPLTIFQRNWRNIDLLKVSASTAINPVQLIATFLPQQMRKTQRWRNLDPTKNFRYHWSGQIRPPHPHEVKQLMHNWLHAKQGHESCASCRIAPVSHFLAPRIALLLQSESVWNSTSPTTALPRFSLPTSTAGVQIVNSTTKNSPQRAPLPPKTAKGPLWSECAGPAGVGLTWGMQLSFPDSLSLCLHPDHSSIVLQLGWGFEPIQSLVYLAGVIRLPCRKHEHLAPCQADSLLLVSGRWARITNSQTPACKHCLTSTHVLPPSRLAT